MQKNLAKRNSPYVLKHLLSILIGISVIFLYPNITLSGPKYYYYLQSGSFRIKKDAIKFIEKLEKNGYEVVAKHQKIGDQGNWYIVYIGPLSSQKKAKLTIRALRKKKLARYIAVHQKRSLISSDFKAGTRKTGKKTIKAKKPLAPVLPAKKTKRMQRGIGRNLAGKNFALGYRHLYREVATEIVKRKQITSAGSSTVVMPDSEKDDFPTSMHIDSLYARYGLTDYLEIFLDAGGGYKESSSVSFVYGGGLQLSFFEVENGVFKGLYTSLSGAYLNGTVEHEYDSPAGNEWNKEAEFKEFTVKGELGMIRSRFAAYLGAVFLDYNETTTRDKLTGIDPPLTSFIYEDELENENSFGGFAGVEIYITPSYLIKIEGQLISKESIFVALEYHF